MVPSFDYAMSSLLCAEENESIFDDIIDDNNNINNNNNNVWDDKNENFILQSEECLSSMFEKERQYFCGVDYLKRLRFGDLDLLSRNEAVDWIHKVQSHYNFGPLCLYSSVNYLDRFLSTYELPGKAWMMQLLAVACLSIAAKMDETDVPFSLDLQICGSKFVFEAKTIQRMELLVMSTLNWRMQLVTPFSFIDYFLYKLSVDQLPPPSIISQAIELILCSIKAIELLQFKPSEIAASVAISVTQETRTILHPDIASSFSSFFPQQLHKERVMKCVEMIQVMRLNSKCNGDSGFASTTMPQSPIGVLDASCLSYQSDELSSMDPFWSCVNSDHINSDFGNKRRKLDNNMNFRLES
ncbi:hypothetical protein vseg_009528 [Gypsophila vaccaria]